MSHSFKLAKGLKSKCWEEKGATSTGSGVCGDQRVQYANEQPAQNPEEAEVWASQESRPEGDQGRRVLLQDSHAQGQGREGLQGTTGAAKAEACTQEADCGCSCPRFYNF